MDPWLIWLIAAVIFAVGEIATLGFFLAPFAGGALLAAVVSAAGAGDFISWSVFIVISIVLLGALRPLARSHRRQPASLRTGTAALVGRTGTVVAAHRQRRGQRLASASRARTGPRAPTTRTR